MTDSERIPKESDSTWLKAISASTPARIFVDRCGQSYGTPTWLGLRRDHAIAVDAVHDEFVLERDFAPDFVARHELFAVQSRAVSKREYLQRPDLGRQFCDAARDELLAKCSTACDLQLVIGDGLSAAAVIAQVPQLLPRLQKLSDERTWRLGQPFVVRYCRVGILNEIGELLAPRVVVLLIGERPGLATATSLSAYMAFRPRSGHTDAQRNLISNIHERGVSCELAAERIMRLADAMCGAGMSGITLKEPPPGTHAGWVSEPNRNHRTG